MRVLTTKGSENSPFFSVAASTLGTAVWTWLIQTNISGEVPTSIRVFGRLVSPTGGGIIVLGCGLVNDATIPTGSLGNAVGGTVTGANNISAAVIQVAAAAATSFAAVFQMHTSNGGAGDAMPIASKHISFRVSNTSTAFSAGTFYIDSVELLG